jgi:hypothetical protein
MRALLHVHSSWSYDGEATLDELARWGAGRGLGAILLTEHVNDFDAVKMESYVGAVDALAGSACRLVPGLEFAVRGGFHLLGFDLRAWTSTVDPVAAARFIRDQGGIAVLAHPARYKGRWPEDDALAALHGIEVWNARYDGRFFPPGDLIETARDLCARFGHLGFFGGQDLHQRSRQRLVVTDVEAATLEGFLGALRRRAARFGAPGFRLDARPDRSAGTGVLIKLGHRCYRFARERRTRWVG